MSKTYKNASVGAHVHAGQIVAPGSTFDADATPNLEKLVKCGILELVSGGTGTSGDGDDADKAALIARAQELGIEVKGNWGVPKLTAEIEAAEKKAAGGTGNSGAAG